MLFSASVGMLAAGLIDVGFYLILAALAAREVLAAKNRNAPIVGIVLLFGFANAIDHAGAAGLMSESGAGYRAGIALIVILISLIGGRIVPSFTRNWLTKQGLKEGLPGQPNTFDMTVIAITAAALIGWMLSPSAVAAGALLVVAGMLQAMRLVRWQGHRTYSDPLVVILHVGYAWVPVGLALLGASLLGAPFPASAGIHALTAGAMATMILAVMTRATLGHTGRDLQASPATTFLYMLITLGALLRVSAPLGLVNYTIGMELAAVAWAGAFILFIFAYGPILFRPRLGE